MDLGMKNQLALVTGSTSGHGKEMAKILLQEGAKVVINSYSDEELESVRGELNTIGEAYFIKCDITDNKDVTKMMDAVYEIGELDMLVNNVGVWRDDDFWDITDELWDYMFQMNFYGAVRTMRYAIPRMIKRNYGRVLNVSSEVGFRPSGAQVHYGVCKTALISLSSGVARACQGTNVLVNTSIPGPMWTPTEKKWQEDVVAKLDVDFDEYIDQYMKVTEPTSLVQRYLQPEEVARVGAFYLSPFMTATTGAAIRADGGIIHHI